MEQQPHLNDHNKQEYPPMHTTEHIINQTMIRLFSCGRSISAHIERKKSKLDYRLADCPAEEEVKKLEEAVNEVIARHLPVTTEFHHARGSTRTFRPEAPARQCLRNGTCREGRRLRRMSLHRSTCRKYIGNRNFQNHQPRLGRRSKALENAF